MRRRDIVLRETVVALHYQISLILLILPYNPAGIYLFKVNNRNTRTRCEICSKLTIKTPERRQWRVIADWEGDSEAPRKKAEAYLEPIRTSTMNIFCESR